MARTLLVRMASGVTTPKAELILRGAFVVAETIVLEEHATVKRTYTGTITVAAGQYDINLKSGASYIGGDEVTIASTDGLTYRAQSGVDWGNVSNQSSVVSLSNTTVKNVTDSTTVVINATSPQLATIVASGEITIHRGDYTTIGLTVGSLVGRTDEKLFFTIREEKPADYDEDPADETALLQITETSGALIVKAASWTTAADGAIVVTTEATGVLEIRIKSAITTVLPIVDSYWYDIQLIRSDGEPITVAEGRLNIAADVTRRSIIA